MWLSSAPNAHRVLLRLADSSLRRCRTPWDLSFPSGVRRRPKMASGGLRVVQSWRSFFPSIRFTQVAAATWSRTDDSFNPWPRTEDGFKHGKAIASRAWHQYRFSPHCLGDILLIGLRRAGAASSSISVSHRHHQPPRFEFRSFSKPNDQTHIARAVVFRSTIDGSGVMFVTAQDTPVEPGLVYKT